MTVRVPRGLAAALACTAFASMVHAAADVQDLTALRRIAETAARQGTADLPGRVVIEVPAMDSRVRLPACESLETFTPRGDPQVLMSFAVTEGGRLVFSVNLESSTVLREAGFGWILVVQEGDVRINTEVRYYERPAYPVLRSDVEVLIRQWTRAE